MKKILLILCLFPILVFSQKSYKIPADSTILNNIGSGKNELVIRNATSNITGGVLTNLGNGVTAFVLGGGSARVVDTIYKNSAKDSIVFTISGIRYAVKDSIGITDLSGYALQISLNDTANTLRRIRKVDSSYLFKNATRDSICMVTVINGNTYRTCAFDSSNVNTDSQSLQLFFTDSILLGITRGNSIKFAYAVDSVGLNAGGDSIVVIKAGLRLAYKVGSSGGGALSSLTAATATNIINNGNFQQEWQWNSLANNTGFKLSSSAPGAGSANVQKLFESQLTGAMINTGTTSWAGYFNNQQTVGHGNGIYARGERAGEFVGNVTVSSYLLASGILISQIDGNKSSEIKSAGLQDFFINSQGTRLLNSVSGCVWALTINKKSATEYVMGIGGVDYGSSNYRSEFTTATFIERSSDKLLFSTNSGLAGGYSPFSPTYQMSIVGSTSNVGIGTTSPVASAKLEVSSTTSGFLPPRMTATQRDAISSPATGLTLFCTDCTATDASTGVMQTYNGATWKNFW